MIKYKKAAIELAYKSGKIIRKNFALGVEKTWKADNTPLTETDIAVNKLVIETLSKDFPDHGIIAEEKSLTKNSKYQWVCDPLDGTVPFSHGYPIFTFALALVKEGSPVLGVIYDPILDRLFYAEKGAGTFLNDKKIRVSQQKKLDDYSIIELNVYNRLLNLPNLIVKKDQYSVSFVSASYAGCLVASGQFTASIYDWRNPWDGAAVKIIVEEAGGKVTDVFGKDQRYDEEINGFITSNGFVHNEILDLCEEAMEG